MFNYISDLFRSLFPDVFFEENTNRNLLTGNHSYLLTGGNLIKKLELILYSETIQILCGNLAAILPGKVNLSPGGLETQSWWQGWQKFGTAEQLLPDGGTKQSSRTSLRTCLKRNHCDQFGWCFANINCLRYIVFCIVRSSHEHQTVETLGRPL